MLLSFNTPYYESSMLSCCLPFQGPCEMSDYFKLSVWAQEIETELGVVVWCNASASALSET